MNHYLILSLVLGSAMAGSVAAKKLTLLAALTGGLIGFAIYQGAGFTGIFLLSAFFLLGTLATSWKIELKEKERVAERDRGKRKPGQVLANGGVAAILGLIIWAYPETSVLLQLTMAGSLSAAAADTLSSELGMVYGRRFYNIRTFRRDKKGLDGVISLEGTVCGIFGSVVIALIYSIGFGWNLNFLIIIIAGTIGNLVDSLLGATLERKGVIQNNTVNFLNTLAGAFAAMALSGL